MVDGPTRHTTVSPLFRYGSTKLKEQNIIIIIIAPERYI